MPWPLPSKWSCTVHCVLGLAARASVCIWVVHGPLWTTSRGPDAEVAAAEAALRNLDSAAAFELEQVALSLIHI